MSSEKESVEEKLKAWSHRFDKDGKLTSFTFTMPPPRQRRTATLKLSDFGVTPVSPKDPTPRPWGAYEGNW